MKCQVFHSKEVPVNPNCPVCHGTGIDPNYQPDFDFPCLCRTEFLAPTWEEVPALTIKIVEEGK